jgi:hypothetical protein
MYWNEAKDLKEEIHESCRLGWERYIQFKITSVDEDKEDLTTEFIQTLKRDGDEHCKVFVQGACVNKRRLEKAGYTVESAASAKTLKTKIKTALRDCELEWQAYANAEWRKSDIGHASVHRWYQQFSSRGYGYVAKNLLKGLRVITKRELREAFKGSSLEGDGIGQRCLHAYVADDEPGASSNSVCDVLSKLWNERDVFSLDLGNENFFSGLNADLLYVYEDGLWSGVELVKRLGQLSKIPALMESNVRIEFRYCAVADAGLAAGRLAVSNYPAGKFTVLSAEHMFKFIREGVDPKFSDLQDRSDASVRRAIDSSIEPYIFSHTKLWSGNAPAAAKICGDIGAQLIKPFLENQARRKARKAASSQGLDVDAELEVPEIDTAKISKWKLGAEGYASTVVFDFSVPKPVLPVIWLAGSVEIDGETVEWVPLFWDSRRIGLAAPRI